MKKLACSVSFLLFLIPSIAICEDKAYPLPYPQLQPDRRYPAIEQGPYPLLPYWQYKQIQQPYPDTRMRHMLDEQLKNKGMD